MCKYCGQIVKDQSGLSQHEKRHTGSEPYINVKSVDWGSLVYGITRDTWTLTSEKRTSYAVDVENRLLVKEIQKYIIIMRIRIILLNADLCPRSYPSRDKLRDHMNKHLGQRNHTCLLCPKVYFAKKQLQHHIKVKHPANLCI